MLELYNQLPSVAQFIIALILILTFYFLFFNFSSATVSSAPTLLTSIGIFGTFLGIALGLHDFDTGDIKGSVPQLIDGLKTAFWSSIAGLFGALLIKARHLFHVARARVTESDVHGATVDDLANLLNDVNRSLVGEEESTLLSQMKLARQDSNDKLDALKRSMEEALKTMAENNSKSLIEALKEVIRDFNAKINEQFGENFKQLNEAVGKILEWQERYRQQMEEMIKQQTLTTENMAIATLRYTEVIERTEDFAQVAEALSTLLRKLDTQRHQLDTNLRQLGELITKAADGMPKIEERIMEITRQIEQGANNHAQVMQHALETTRAGLATANDELNAHVEQMTEQARNQIVELDKALTEELTKSLETLGQQLTALSQQFVDDYQPLTDRLREVVNLAQRV